MTSATTTLRLAQRAAMNLNATKANLLFATTARRKTWHFYQIICLIHFGRFGSANTMMKSGVDRDRIAKADEIIAFEMEGAGVLDQYPTIIIKAACDYADSHKNKDWQGYSAAMTAACLKIFL